MKREKLLESMHESGVIFVRHGKKHDIYENPCTHEYIHVHRHPDINEYTAKGIIKKSVK